MDNVNKWLTLAANIGVMAGIFFLLIELNQDASIASAEAFQQTQSELSEWRAMVLADDDLIRVWGEFVAESNMDELTGESRMQLGFLILSQFAIYESAYYSESYGVFGEIELEHMESRACTEYNRAMKLGLTRAFEIMSADYIEHLESNC